MNESRVAKDAVLAEFKGEDSVLLDIEARRYHRLNETAAFIWKALEEKATDAAIVDGLMSEFEVSRERAQESLERFLGELTQRGLVSGRGDVKA